MTPSFRFMGVEDTPWTVLEFPSRRKPFMVGRVFAGVSEYYVQGYRKVSWPDRLSAERISEDLNRRAFDWCSIDLT